MLDHFSHSELACPTTDQVRLAAGFGEALERLRIELDEPMYLTSAWIVGYVPDLGPMSSVASRWLPLRAWHPAHRRTRVA